jgi:hypothetical protein
MGAVTSCCLKRCAACGAERDPFKDGSDYTLRFKITDGYRIAPHWHRTDENVTVLRGMLGPGWATNSIQRPGKSLHAGGFLCMPEGNASLRLGKGPSIFRFTGSARSHHLRESGRRSSQPALDTATKLKLSDGAEHGHFNKPTR